MTSAGRNSSEPSAHHAGVPVSSETYWNAGYGDIRIDLRDMTVDAAIYATELYTLPIGVEYRILEDRDKETRTLQATG